MRCSLRGFLFHDPDKCLTCGFVKFHEENPHVYTLLRKFAYAAVAAGRDRFSIDLIYHRARWYTMIETDTGDDFKLNDHWTSRYARLLMEREAPLRGLFETRKLRGYGGELELDAVEVE